MLNVLSIDWDYFVDADAGQRLLLFPDAPNEKYGYMLRDFIWASIYAGSKGNDLAKIGTLPLLNTFLQDIKPDLCPLFFVVESHRFAYEFTLRALRLTGDKSVRFVNFDYHHDTGYLGRKTDCGNWLRRLMKECPGEYLWVGQADSCMTQKAKGLRFTTDYAEADVAGTAWDVLFVCRSDLWSPPHLDKIFIESFYPFTESCTGIVEPHIWEDRYLAVQDQAAQLREAYGAAMGKHTSAGK